MVNMVFEFGINKGYYIKINKNRFKYRLKEIFIYYNKMINEKNRIV